MAGTAADGGRDGRWLESLSKSERLLFPRKLSEEDLS